MAYHNPFDVAGVLGRLDVALAWFIRCEVDAVAVTGDLTHDGDADAFSAVLSAVLSGWSGTIFAIAGNHDVLEGSEALSESVRANRSSRVVLAGPEDTPLAGTRLASVEPDQAPEVSGWGDEPVVLLSHYPTLSRAETFAERGLRYPADQPRQESICRALRERRAPTVVISGHIHARDACQEGALLQLSVGALVEPPFEATIVDVTHRGNAVFVRRIARSLRESPGVAAPVLAPASETRALRT